MKLLTLLLLVLSLNVSAAYKMELVADDLQIVWGIEFLDNSLLITERSGAIKLIDLKTNKITSITGAPKVYNRGQGGLLDIKKHPDFAKNKRIYLSYSKSLKDTKTTALGYGTLNGNKLENFKDIFVAKGIADKRIHFGSRIVFSHDGKIFLSVGERGNRPNAQDLTNNFGKIMRLNDDGTSPKDNPFVGKKDALDNIWSYGHRNPQGLVYDQENKILYEMEHGPRGGDEINIIEKGKNYGWPLQSFGKEYWNPLSVGDETVKGMTAPIKYYVPSIAPCGLILYTGKKHKELKGGLISGALAMTHLNIYFPETKKELRLFEDKGMRVRTISSDENGDIYFSVDKGHIYKLTNE